MVISPGCAPTSITSAHSAGYYLTNKQTSARDKDIEENSNNKKEKLNWIESNQITMAHMAGYYLTNKQTSAKNIDSENSKGKKGIQN